MKKIVIVTGILTLSGLVGYFFGQKKPVDLTLVEKSDFLKDFSIEVGKIWRNADHEGDTICKNAKNVDESYYQCNPSYFKCLISNSLINPYYQKNKISIAQNGEFQTRVTPSHTEYLFDLLVDKKYPLKLRLKDSCREVYLPQRFYPFMANQRTVTIEWDSFGRDIFVDKNLVRNKDILNWAKRSGKEKTVQEFEKKPDEEIATNLSIEDMSSFCSSQGKHILSARVYDAMAIHPEDIASPDIKLLRAPYFPWSRKNTETKIFKIQKNLEVNLSESDRLRLCQRVYSSDCGELDYIHQSIESTTWTGAKETLGGVFEYMTNTIHPRENLKLSSRYYPWKSKVHRLGVRGYWDGEGFSANNFELGKYNLVKFPDNIEIGFRCMRFK